jgi:hypothetical protein
MSPMWLFLAFAVLEGRELSGVNGNCAIGFVDDTG